MATEFWSSVPVDLEKYKAGANRAITTSTVYDFCTCVDCENLRALRDEILAARNGPTFFGVARYSKADAAKVKMSIEVTSPGIHELGSLEEQTKGRFTHVFFPEAGKYSLVSIYKAARNAPDGLMMLDDEVIAAFGTSGVSDSYSETFSSIFVMGDLSGDAWNEIKDKIYAILNGESEEEAEEEELDSANFDGVYLVEDRFIPMFFFNEKYTIITSADGDNKVPEKIPGLPCDDPKRSMNYFDTCARKLPKSFGFGDDKHAIPFAYDTENHALVTGIGISDMIYHLIVGNKDKFDEKTFETFNHVISPGEFAEAICADFDSNGANDYAITEFWPKKITARWSHWATLDKLDQSVTHPGYLAAVSFQGKPIIGNGSLAGGNVHIRFNAETGRPWLMKSPWCQRLNSWSKRKHGVIDQLYDIWGLADWLSGPFAESRNLESKAAPLIFCGNKAQDRKKSALDMLRNKLAEATK